MTTKVRSKTKEVVPPAPPLALNDALLAAMPHPLVGVDAKGMIIYANPPAEQFLDMSASMLKRQSLPGMLPFGSPVLALMEQVRDHSVTVSEYGIEIATPRLSPRAVDVHLSPIADVNGGVLIMFQERSIAQKMDRQMTQRHATRSVTSMAAILAHEIKNPLAGIRGAAQLIEQNAGEGDRVLTRLICEETDRIRKLVDRMEVFTDRRPLDRKPVNIHEVLDHVKHLAKSGFAREVTFVESYDPSLPDVMGEKDRLIQVLLNLVKNATDAVAGRPDGEIVMQTAYRPGVHLTVGGTRDRLALPLEVSIRDNGAGVPADMLSSMFEPFVTSKPKGQGLGLAIVAKIISDHGGTIECESEPKRTVFRVRLPMHR
ncbi:MAG: PAS domain-containing protein [Alphaproteobacteria bacterium]|nr:PAS domain-containing protein [Alphaproteobacteria bacterium]